MKNNNGQQPFPFRENPWSHNPNSVWLASTVNLHRNIEKYKFPGKLNSDRKKQIVALVSNDLLALGKEKNGGLSSPVLIKAEEMSALDKEFLMEHFLTREEYNQAGAGDAFVVDETSEFLAILNMRDHIQLQILDTKGELESAWNHLVKIESQLGKTINYSYSPKFGFLTADPTQCGTAMFVNIYLQIGGLVHTGKLDDILEKFAEDSLAIFGIQGSPNEIIGDILVVQNNYTLGLTEETIISSLRNFATKIMVEENSIRSKLKKEKNADLKDKVSRAYGILVHSYQIEAIEALNALSLLKLGAEAGWVTGTDNTRVNELFFNCRRAHLLSQKAEKVGQEEIPHLRAERIHEALQAVKLMI